MFIRCAICTNSSISDSNSQNNCDNGQGMSKCMLWSEVPLFSSVGLRENFCTNINSDSFWCFTQDEDQTKMTECNTHCNGKHFFKQTYVRMN